MTKLPNKPLNRTCGLCATWASSLGFTPKPALNSNNDNSRGGNERSILFRSTTILPNSTSRIHTQNPGSKAATKIRRNNDPNKIVMDQAGNEFDGLQRGFHVLCPGLMRNSLVISG